VVQTDRKIGYLKSGVFAHVPTDEPFYLLPYPAKPCPVNTQLSYDFIAVAAGEVRGIDPVPEFAGEIGLDGGCEGKGLGF
jgi:hypothetical protein